MIDQTEPLLMILGLISYTALAYNFYTHSWYDWLGIVLFIVLFWIMPFMLQSEPLEIISSFIMGYLMGMVCRVSAVRSARRGGRW